ncbi:MAG: NCS2 family permease [Armatimonadetes bacterium]|nr:NCS2 family permease [Armatimonadota bacterium]
MAEASGVSGSGAWLERLFRLRENRTTVQTELVAGLTTFVTMAYIIFVNPLILGSLPDPTGATLSKAAVMTATCLTAGVMSLLMGLYSNYPIAVAAGMGLNAIVAYELVGQHRLTWAGAMGIIVVEGAVITLLVLGGIREAIMNSIPLNLKRAIGAGIGLFIAFIGLQQAGIVTFTPERLAMGDITRLPTVLAILSLIVTAYLVARGVKAGLLFGILGTTLAAIAANAMTGGNAGFPPGSAVLPTQVVALPRTDTIGRFDFSAFALMGIIPAALVAFSVMLSDFFDTIGTVVAIGEQAGYVGPEGTLPRARRVLLVDSVAAMMGGMTGSSSATSYIESAAGVAAGGRTGLTAAVVGLCFLLAKFVNPLAGVVPQQAVAPALIIVGVLMFGVAKEIPFERIEEGLPAFVTMVLMPFTTSITNGIAAGFLLYTAILLLLGRGREIRLPMYVADLGFLIYFLRPVIEVWLR